MVQALSIGRRAVGLVTSAPIFLVMGIMLVVLSLGAEPMAAIGTLLLAIGFAMIWIGLLVELILRYRLHARWPTEAIARDLDRFRNEAAQVLARPTWTPLALAPFSAGMATLALSISDDQQQIPSPLFVIGVLAAGAGAVALAWALHRGRVRRLAHAVRLGGGGGGASGRPTTAAPSIRPPAPVIEGLDVARAVGLIGGGERGPRAEAAEPILWLCGGMPAGLKAGSTTDLSGVQREASPHDAAILTDRALYLVNVIEPVQPIQQLAELAPAADPRVTSPDRRTSFVRASRKERRLRQLVSEVGLTGVVAADPRNIRFGYDELLTLEIKERRIRDPLLTAETRHGTREKFVLYVEDLGAMQAALSSAPAPFHWRLRNP
jgi:hypothetical protein